MIEMMVIVAFILFVTFISRFYVHIKYDIPVEIYRTVNQFHKRLEIGLVIMFIVTVIVFILTPLHTFATAVVIGYFATESGVRAYMEYKHGIEEKSHLPNLVAAVGSSAALIVVIMFLI
ncbi:DUF4181 domain-containing protein [Alkalibacillus haloalkaliphilus]|uniref:DUF4181 domain-containing protein n=1 Tax=Alkalibacillus haloalkaliphilus TaxID=94136 RepID=UPI0029366BA7|nr:DUF4181 domain-containing protein [Alkalibacillus haloalkaliphilus]MDV2582400.1 DUF4181 domain-containing protein [Alkalibacillus haloalkaliphilus]